MTSCHSALPLPRAAPGAERQASPAGSPLPRSQSDNDVGDGYLLLHVGGGYYELLRPFCESNLAIFRKVQARVLFDPMTPLLEHKHTQVFIAGLLTGDKYTELRTDRISAGVEMTE